MRRLYERVADYSEFSRTRKKGRIAPPSVVHLLVYSLLRIESIFWSHCFTFKFKQ